MDRDIENQIKELNLKLRSVFEEQDRNQSAIQAQEQAEADFYECRSRNRRLFDRILGTWHGDREMSQFFMNTYQDAQHIERKVTFELENKKKRCLKKDETLMI